MLFNLCEINTEVVLRSLDILWQGLLAVVIGIGVIIAVTYFMLFVSNRVADKKKSVENETLKENKSDTGER